MPLASDDDIDSFGLDEFSVDFLEELDRAEEAFPSSFCPIPPSSQLTSADDEYDSMFLDCSQEMADALDVMEQPDFVLSQCKSEPDSEPCGSSPSSSPLCNGRRGFSPSPTPDLRFNPKHISNPTSPSVCIKTEDAVSPVKNMFSRKRARSVTETILPRCKKHKPFSSPSPPPSPPPPTHLSQFFAAYPKYQYDPSGPASQQLQKLKSLYTEKGKWSRADTAALYAGYNRALGMTFSQTYGDDVDSLENWQRLCRVVEIDVPASLEECQTAIEDAHVNLIDLIDITTTGIPVHKFQTEMQLSLYTRATKKFFPRDRAYKGLLLQHLLRRIMCPPAENLMRRGGCWVERNS